MSRAAHLSLVPVEPFSCVMPWGLREPEAVHGANCCFCARDVAVAADQRGKHVACIYCGLDRGYVPEQEVEP